MKPPPPFKNNTRLGYPIIEVSVFFFMRPYWTKFEGILRETRTSVALMEHLLAHISARILRRYTSQVSFDAVDFNILLSDFFLPLHLQH